jgi:hypothetical protein
MAGRGKAQARRAPRTATKGWNGAVDSLEALVPLLEAGEGGLLGDVAGFIRRYVVMSPARLVATALWVVHTHAMEAAEQTPYLAITSPARQCGKTRLMEVLELLVREPWLMELPSEAVLYRTIHANKPTVLWDEVDTVFNPKTADRYEGQRAVINAGNRRGVTVPRCVGSSARVFDFRVYSAKALAGIGTLPDTVADRSLPIRLERRKRDETVERLRRREAEPAGHAIRHQVAAWAEQSIPRLAKARPRVPDELSDRQQDACEPLLAIADRMGRPWPKLARLALVELCTGERLDDVETMRLTLLRDLKAIFKRLHRPKVSTATLLAELHQVPESPWKTYYKRGLDDRDLAGLLRHYGVHSKKVRIGKKVLMGYKRDDLVDVWERYT